MIIILFGPQGSGKGTIGSMLESSLGIPLIGTGQLMREEISKGTDLGKEAEKYVAQGELVPTDIVIEVLTKKLDLMRKGCILDGFPRNEQQMRAFGKYLSRQAKEIDNVFLLDLPESISVERLSLRQVCSKCEKIYNVKTMPPKVTGICDKCGKALEKRHDESEEAVKKRLDIFKKETLPVIHEFEKKGILVKIDASRKPQEILNDILKHYSLPQ